MAVTVGAASREHGPFSVSIASTVPMNVLTHRSNLLQQINDRVDLRLSWLDLVKHRGERQSINDKSRCYDVS